MYLFITQMLKKSFVLEIRTKVINYCRSNSELLENYLVNCNYKIKCNGNTY